LPTVINQRLNWRLAVGAGLIVLAVAGLVNLGLAAVYSGRTYPLTRAYGMDLGGLTREQLRPKLDELNEAYRLQVKEGGASESLRAIDLGVNFAGPSSLQTLTAHPWYDPAVARLWDGTARWRPDIDDIMLDQAVMDFTKRHDAVPTNATVTLSSNGFKAQPDKPGELADLPASQKTVRGALERAARTVSLKTAVVQGAVATHAAEVAATAANEVRNLKLSFTNGGATYTPSVETISSWINFLPAPDGHTLLVRVDQAKMADYVAQVAQKVNVEPVARVVSSSGAQITAGKNGSVMDQDAAVAEMGDAVGKRQSASIALMVSPVAFQTTTKVATSKAGITYSYCVQMKGVDASFQPGFASEVARVYADARGWSLGGEINFVQVAAGCTFTVWLSAASLVPSFDEAACSDYYSCTVGRNVIINFDRWQGATPPWTLGITNYHSMVVNHETGHWLGLGHRYCPGPGQLAPVMQQQSISLQGCTANPWPTEPELQTVAAARGL
jgi:vancomycin resistance protein YoaR